MCYFFLYRSAVIKRADATLEAEEEPISAEDCWTVIASYFAQHTLVSQQINSFNEFVNNTMQELVDENADLILDQNIQHTGKEGDVAVSIVIRAVVQCAATELVYALLAAVQHQLWSDLPVPSYNDRGGWVGRAHVPKRGSPTKFDVSGGLCVVNGMCIEI
jgi:hypothetical protein